MLRRPAERLQGLHYRWRLFTVWMWWLARTCQAVRVPPRAALGTAEPSPGMLAAIAHQEPRRGPSVAPARHKIWLGSPSPTLGTQSRPRVRFPTRPAPAAWRNPVKRFSASPPRFARQLALPLAAIQQKRFVHLRHPFQTPGHLPHPLHEAMPAAKRGCHGHPAALGHLPHRPLRHQRAPRCQLGLLVIATSAIHTAPCRPSH